MNAHAYKLRKLAIALRNMDLDESDSVEEMIERYYGGWLHKLPDLATDLWESGVIQAKDIVKEKYLDLFWKGSGAFRFVVGIKNDDTFVVKVARNPNGVGMNKSEFERQLEFGGMFPKVHYHGMAAGGGTEFDWIVVEAISVISNAEEMFSFFPNLLNAMNQIGGKTFRTKSILGALLQWEVGHHLGEPEEYRPSVKGVSRGLGTEAEQEQLLEAARKDSLFNRVAALAAKLGIDAWDLGVGNLGVNKSGDLMIIDSSFRADYFKHN